MYVCIVNIFVYKRNMLFIFLKKFDGRNSSETQLCATKWESETRIAVVPAKFVCWCHFIGAVNWPDSWLTSAICWFGTLFDISLICSDFLVNLQAFKWIHSAFRFNLAIEKIYNWYDFDIVIWRQTFLEDDLMTRQDEVLSEAWGNNEFCSHNFNLLTLLAFFWIQMKRSQIVQYIFQSNFAF